MAIQAYFGLPRSGKSYNAVANVLVPALKDNRTVVTNLPLVKEALFKDIQTGSILQLPHDMNGDTVSKHLKIENFPPGCVFILDECFSLFPSGQKAHTVPQSLKEFFSMHGHVVGVDQKAADIYLMSQNIDQLAEWVKNMLQSMVIHTNLEPTGLAKQYRCDFYQFELHGTKLKEKFIQSSVGKIKSPYKDYYISNSRSEAGMNGDVLENIIDQRTSLAGAHKKNFIIAGIAGLFSIALMGYALSFVWDDEDQPESEPTEEHTPQQPEPAPRKQPAKNIAPNIAQTRHYSAPVPNYSKPKFQTLPESKDWKLTGVIKSRSKSYALISSTKATVRLSLLNNCFYSRNLDQWACWYQDAMVAHHTGPSFEQEDTENPLDDVFPGFDL